MDRYAEIHSMGDSVTAMVFVLLSQSFAVLFSPEVAVPPDRLFRGIKLALPVLSAMRMILRPRAEWPTPFLDSKLPADEIYKKAWWLNILFIATLHSMVISNPHSLPEWVPEHDFLRTFFPFHVFIVWFRIQQNPLIRRDKIETVFTDWKKKEKGRNREILIKGIEKGEPFWVVSGAAGNSFYLLCHTVGVRPFPVAERASQKAANRIATDAMQQEIDQPDFYWWPPKPTRWQRLKTWLLDASLLRTPS